MNQQEEYLAEGAETVAAESGAIPAAPADDAAPAAPVASIADSVRVLTPGQMVAKRFFR